MDNQQLAIETKNKLEFYFLALVFTLLAASIQTALISKHTFQIFLEFTGWILFLASGLSGLYRMEMLPPIMRLHHDNSGDESILRNILGKENDVVLQDTKTNEHSTDLEMIEAYKFDKRTSIEARKLMIKEFKGKVEFAYSIHKWAFVLALVFIILSRASYYCLNLLATPP